MWNTQTQYDNREDRPLSSSPLRMRLADLVFFPFSFSAFGSNLARWPFWASVLLYITRSATVIIWPSSSQRQTMDKVRRDLLESVALQSKDSSADIYCCLGCLSRSFYVYRTSQGGHYQTHGASSPTEKHNNHQPSLVYTMVEEQRVDHFVVPAPATTEIAV